MRVEYSKVFTKAVKKLSGKMIESVRQTIKETKEAENIKQLTNCEKITGYKNVYRIRIGDLRAFFLLHILVEGDTIIFEYLIQRGQAYNKKIMDNLRKKDT